VNFQAELVPVEISADVITHPGLSKCTPCCLHRTALKRSLRRQYDDALAYLALLKRSPSACAAEHTVAVQSHIAELAILSRRNRAQQQHRKSLKTCGGDGALRTLTLDEEQGAGAGIEELAAIVPARRRDATRDA
jgi:hypothetical protein